MIDWSGVIGADFAVPADLDTALRDLLAMLASADPQIRDGQAYPVLVTWIRRGRLDDRLGPVGAAMVERFDHPEVPARAFAPLILAAAVGRDTAAGVLDRPTVRRWRDAFAAWWPAEPEIRGFDERSGWLHAVAHGADLAGALGGSPRLDRDDLAALLTLVAERVVAPTGYGYAQQEEDRVARAVTRILGRAELTAADATAWLAPIDRLFATGAPGPLPVPVANTLAVLRATYVMIDRHAVAHRRAVTDALAARLHEAFAAYPVTRAPG